jgi:hypothetical protein
MRTNDTIKTVVLTVFCFATVGMLKAQDIKTVPYYFVYNGSGAYAEKYVYAYENGADCGDSSHKIDGANYDHYHPAGDFTQDNVPYLLPNLTYILVSVTADDSDLYAATFVFSEPWYKVSSSTFSANCFSYATGAPGPLQANGYTQWTTAYTPCTGATHGTSGYWDGEDHCETFSEVNIETDYCYVPRIIQKWGCAGPVYAIDEVEHGVLPYYSGYRQNKH